MSEPFLAEIRIFGFNFAPRGWAQCNGQILPINANQSLYSLLGTTYGGDGRTSFALPDLRGRLPAHIGDTISQGQRGGEEGHALSGSEMPLHGHRVRATTDAAQFNVPEGLLGTALEAIYASIPPENERVGLVSGTTGMVGEGQPHNNIHPSAVINFCIAVKGLFPSRN